MGRRRRPTLVLCDAGGDGRPEELPQHPRVDVLPVGSAGVADVIGPASLVVSQSALDTLEARVGEVSRDRAGEAEEVAS